MRTRKLLMITTALIVIITSLAIGFNIGTQWYDRILNEAAVDAAGVLPSLDP